MRFNPIAGYRESRRLAKEKKDEFDLQLAKEMIKAGKPDVPISQRTLLELKRESERYGVRGQWLFAIAILLGCAMLVVSYHLTGVYLDELRAAEEDRELVLILLLVRGTFFGAMSVGFLFGVFTIANAYIDQSTRFRKRLYSAHMLNYAFRTFSDSIEENGKVKVSDLVLLFAAWNENVDSAFSRVRFQRKSPDLTIGGRYAGLATRDRDGDGEADDGYPSRQHSDNGSSANKAGR